MGFALESWLLNDSLVTSMRTACARWWCRGSPVDHLVGILSRFVYVVDNLKLGQLS